MMPRFPALTPLAGILALLAFCLLAHDLLAPPAMPSPPPPITLAPLPPAQAPAPPTPPITAYAAIAARPLFLPSRRPPPSSAAPAPLATTPPLDFSLVGVVTGPAQNMALVQIPGQAAAVVVHVGAVVQGWTVTRIDRSGIEVQAGATSSHLRIVQ